MNSEGVAAEPKRTKLNVDDPKVTKVELMMMMIMMAAEVNHLEFLERHFPVPEPWTREEEYEFGGLKEIDEELAESGVDIKAMRERWKTCEVKCRKCGDVDYHPEDECSYLRFLYI
ncbi:hypothetical protein OROHE_001112 [Orobanche hederae]